MATARTRSSPRSLLHLRDQLHGAFAVWRRRLDLERVVDLRQAVREDGVEHDAFDLDDPAGVAVLGLVGHESPEGVCRATGRRAKKRLPERSESIRRAAEALRGTASLRTSTARRKG